MKNLFATGLAALLVLAACTDEQDAAPEPGPETQAVAESAAITEATVTYITTENFEDEVINSDIPVLVDFTAEWCIPCKIVDPVIMSLMPEMHGKAKVFKLDIDNDPDIYRRLNVSGVPNVLFFKDGAEQDRISSPQSRETYIMYLQALIEGRSLLDVSLTLIEDDMFRRHFILTRSIEDLEKALEKKPDLLTQPFENGQTPLSLVLNKSSVKQNEQITLVLAQDPVISAKDLAGLGRCEDLSAALADDPDAVNRSDPDGMSPLTMALMRAHRADNGACVDLLLESGADPALDNYQKLPLSRVAVMSRGTEMLEKLLPLGLDPNKVDEEGQNALHWATYYGKLDQVQLLLAHGMSPTVKNFEGKTAIDIAREKIEHTQNPPPEYRKMIENMGEEEKKHLEQRLIQQEELLRVLENAEV